MFAPNGDFSPVLSAVSAGYRLFDTAIAYGNEEGIGEALASCNVPREELFITNKSASAEIRMPPVRIASGRAWRTVSSACGLIIMISS